MDAENQSSGSKRDLAWKYCTKISRVKVKCNFCGIVTSGGIHRAKQHIMGGFRNSKKCKKCPPHVVEEIRSYTMKKST